jgi:hypothetical protein
MSEGDPVLIHLQYIKQSVDGINERLDAQNGRLRTAEGEILVLKDRSDDAKRQGGIWGAIGGIIAGLASAWTAGHVGK